MILFAAAQLHSAIANTEGCAYSIDFRTVTSTMFAPRAAPNLDTHCTGTSLRDFVRAADYTAMPEDAIAPYDTAPRPKDATLVFKAEPAAAKSTVS